MEILTSKFMVYCDTYNTALQAVMHEVKQKPMKNANKTNKKLQLTITGDSEKKEVSLWKEDVLLLADFLKGMAENLDKRG